MPVIPSSFYSQLMMSADLYEGIDWYSDGELVNFQKIWEKWEEKNYPFVRRCMVNLMTTCKSLETVEWFFGRRAINPGYHAQQALWLWRRIKQKRKKEVSGADTTMSGDNDIDRTFIVGDLMIPGTPRESWRQFASPVVGRFSDFEGRLFSPFG